METAAAEKARDLLPFWPTTTTSQVVSLEETTTRATKKEKKISTGSDTF